MPGRNATGTDTSGPASGPNTRSASSVQGASNWEGQSHRRASGGPDEARNDELRTEFASSGGPARSAAGAGTATVSESTAAPGSATVFESTAPAGSATVSESTAPADVSDPAAKWMLWDDEFLLAEDREYVLRDDGSWWDYVSPLLFGAVVAVMVGDVITTGVGLAMGLEEANPVAAVVIREAGLGGLVVLKAMAAVFLLLLPGVTDNARQTFRAGSVAYLLIGVVVVAANAWAILAVAG